MHLGRLGLRLVLVVTVGVNLRNDFARLRVVRERIRLGLNGRSLSGELAALVAWPAWPLSDTPLALACFRRCRFRCGRRPPPTAKAASAPATSAVAIIPENLTPEEVNPTADAPLGDQVFTDSFRAMNELCSFPPTGHGFHVTTLRPQLQEPLPVRATR
jgi:hypothetical protein